MVNVVHPIDKAQVCGTVPVEAAAPTLLYKFTKFARKHRSVLSVAAAIGAVLALSAVISTALAFFA